jgi:hypothetical protein
MVYLDSSDDFGTLTDVLDEWCIASGARFNIGKTEMIPIGSITHRDRVRANRFVNGTDGTAIPGHIKIAAEKEPIRTLYLVVCICFGCWVHISPAICEAKVFFKAIKSGDGAVWVFVCRESVEGIFHKICVAAQYVWFSGSRVGLKPLLYRRPEV